MKKPSILSPIIVVEMSDGTVEVRELRAVDAFTFIRMLSEHAGDIITATQISKGGQEITKRIRDMVAASEDLCLFLASKATGKDPSWLVDLALADFLEILGAALEINLRPELVKKVGGLAALLARTFATGPIVPSAPSPAASTSSSPTATPPPGTTPSGKSTSSPAS